MMMEIIEIDSDGEEVICTGVSFSSQKKEDGLKRKEPLFYPPTPEKNVLLAADHHSRSTKRRKSEVVQAAEDEEIYIIDDPRTVAPEPPVPSIPNPPVLSEPQPPPLSLALSLAQIMENSPIVSASSTFNIPSTSSSLVGQASSVGPTDGNLKNDPSANTKSKQLAVPSDLGPTGTSHDASHASTSAQRARPKEVTIPMTSSNPPRESLPLRLQHAAVIVDHWGIPPQELVNPKHLLAPLSLSSLQILAQIASDGVPVNVVRQYLQASLDAAEEVDGNPPQLTTSLVRDLKAEMSKWFPALGSGSNRTMKDNEGSKRVVVEAAGSAPVQDATESAKVLGSISAARTVEPTRLVSQQANPSQDPLDRVLASKNAIQPDNLPRTTLSTPPPKSIIRKIPQRVAQVNEFEDAEFVQMPFQPPSQQETIDEDVPETSSFIRPRANLSIFKSKRGKIFPIPGITDNVPSSVQTADKGKRKEIRRSPVSAVQPTAPPRPPKPTNRRPFWRTVDDGDDADTTTDSTACSVPGAVEPTMSPAVAAMTSLNMASTPVVDGPSIDKPSKAPRAAFAPPALNRAMEQLIAQEQSKLQLANELPGLLNSVSHAVSSKSEEPIGQVQIDSLSGLKSTNEFSGQQKRVRNEEKAGPRHHANRVARKSVAGRPRLEIPSTLAEPSDLVFPLHFTSGDSEAVGGPSTSTSAPDNAQRNPSVERQAARVRSARKTTGSYLPRTSPSSHPRDKDNVADTAYSPVVEVGLEQAVTTSGTDQTVEAVQQPPVNMASMQTIVINPLVNEATTTEAGGKMEQPRLQQWPIVDVPTKLAVEDSIDLQLDVMAVDQVHLVEPKLTLGAQPTNDAVEGTDMDSPKLQDISTESLCQGKSTIEIAEITANAPHSDGNAISTPAENAPPPSVAIKEAEVNDASASIDSTIAQSMRDIGAQVLSTVSGAADRSIAPGFHAADYLPDEGRLTRRAARAQTPPRVPAASADRLKDWENQLMLHNGTTLSDVDVRMTDPDSLSENGHGHENRSSDPTDRSLRTRNVLQAVEIKAAITSLKAENAVDPDPDMAAFQELSFERFGDPLLNKLNALAKSNGESDIVRTVMEAYISHACQKEKASDITIAPGIIRRGGSLTRAPPPEFVYSNEVLYMDGVPPRIPSKGCKCIGPCRENSDCFCLKRQEKYFASFVIEGGPGYTGFACREDGTIKDAQYPTWECSDECECPPSCRNRVMQRGRDKKVQLEIFETRQKGWGVKTKSFIRRGTFVGIYAGELIPEVDTDTRGMIYGKVGRTYLFDLDHWHISQPPADLAEIDPEGAALAMEVARQLCKEKEDGSTKGLPDNIEGASLFTVDAFHWGFTRYLNHSCDPNLQLGSVYYDDFDVRKPRLCITAKRDIPAGQELTISYFGPADDDMVEGTTQVTSSIETKEKPNKLHKPHVGSAHVAKDDGQQRACLCKARNCRGNMFN